MENRNYTYYAKFDNLEVITKGTKKCMVEGYISTTDKDLASEILSMSAQNDILDQVTDRLITFDAEHEVWFDKEGNENSKPTSNIPLGKIVEAKIKGNGVWVKAEINQDNPRFNNIWDSIKKGFLNAFSVSFYPVEAIKRKVGILTESIVNRLNLINVSLTGNPCNTSATFTPIMKSAVNGFFKDSFDTYQNNKEDDNMSDKEIKNETEEIKPTEAPVKEAKVEEPVKEEAKPEVTTKETTEVVDDKYTDGTDKEKVELKNNITSLKNDIDALKAEVKALKEENEKKEKIITQPINKSIIEKEIVKKTEGAYNTFDYIK